MMVEEKVNMISRMEMKIPSIRKEETVLETVLLVEESSRKKKIRRPSKSSQRRSELH